MSSSCRIGSGEIGKQLGQFVLHGTIQHDATVNVWHHFVKDGKLAYRKAAFASFPLEKDTKYTLVVKKTGKTLTISVAGHTFGYFEDALSDSFYVGITGCEGLNRFYNFTLHR